MSLADSYKYSYITLRLHKKCPLWDTYFSHILIILTSLPDDMGFDEAEAGRDATSMEDGFDEAGLFLSEDTSAHDTLRDENAAGVSSASIASKPKLSLDAPLKDDGFGGTVGEGLLGRLWEC